MSNNLFKITLLLISTIALSAYPVSAAVPSVSKEPPTASASGEKSVGEKLNQQINQLKERIASRVAELNLVEKRGIIGTVSDTSGNQITFSDITNKTRFIDVDEITKFESPDSKSSFGLSDLVKGTKISVLGLYNKQSQRILGRFIETPATPTFLSGRIAEIDKKNFTLTIMSVGKKQTKVDIGTSTGISIYSKEEGISKFGFSKLNIGDRVMATGFPDKKDPELLAAVRILDLSELPANPAIIIPEPTAEEEESLTPANSKETTPSPAVTKRVTPSKPLTE